LPYLYSIDDGVTQQASPLFRKLGPGIYPVVITDGKGCTWRDEIEVLEEEGIQVTLPDDLTIELSDEVRIEGTTNIDPSTITQLTWYPPYGLDRTDSLVVLAKPGIAVLYTLTIQDERGCIGIDSITIVVHDPDLFIPTVFSPSNGDGVNDIFMIFGEVKGLVRINRFEVFSRWGERLFLAEDIQPNDPKGGWDGTQSGHKLNPGVYVYYAQILLTDGRVKTMKGEVILLE
jgi:gliding motility-associated-like protein